MPAQDLHIRLLHLRNRLRPATLTADETVGLRNEFLHKMSETVSGKLICMLIVLPRVLTWQHCNRLQWANTHILTQILRYWLVFWSTSLPSFKRYLWATDAYL
jgi:hypothetical protein